MIAGVRAQAQAALGGEEAAKAFTEFRDLVNHVEVQEKKDHMTEVMKKWSKVPEVRFAPVQQLGKQKSLRSVRREKRDPSLLPPREGGIRRLNDSRPVKAIKKGK